MSTSVSGVRCQMTLQKYFMRIGGYYMIGDVVSKGNFDGNRLLSVETRNFASDRLSADNFIFAAGSFYSHGMVATPSAIVEPVLGLDTEYRGSRPEWYNEDIFRKQPYMKFGIATDADFRAIRDGKNHRKHLRSRLIASGRGLRQRRFRSRRGGAHRPAYR